MDDEVDDEVEVRVGFAGGHRLLVCEVGIAEAGAGEGEEREGEGDEESD